MSNGPNDWLFSGLPIQITVESASHVDWFNIASTIVGIVFGALLTFWLSRISENAREMDLQQRMLNGVLSEVASNINTLLVFKRQFLIQFSSEFELLKRHAQKYVPGVPPPPQLVIEFNEHMRPLLNQIAEQDPSLNNIVKKWNKIPFIHVDGSALPFVLDEIPDLLFLVAMGNGSVRAIENVLEMRDELWRRCEERGGVVTAPTPQSMLVTYEFIDFRQNLQSEVNVALAVWHEVMTKLGRYTKAKFERKQWWSFMRKRKFVRIEVPLQYQDLMPRREDHENLLGPLEK